MADHTLHPVAAASGVAKSGNGALRLNAYRHRPPLRFFKALIAAGGLVLVGGLVLAPERVLPAALLAGLYLLGLALAGLFFIALQALTGAQWSKAIERVPEGLASVVPVAALVLAGVLLAVPWLYPWTHGHDLHGFKQFWLDLPFFWGRSVVYLLVWVAFAKAILRRPRGSQRARLAAVFMPVFAVTLWLASVDWIMSLDAHWYSTIFGAYQFAGMFSSGLAAMIVLAVYLQRSGPLREALTVEHLHDLSKLLFGFSTFWMYIWFSQYMLIWYANIPEETVYFVRRFEGAWAPLVLLNVLLNWGLPFLALLSQRIKYDDSAMVKIAVVILLGRWLDLYLMIFPSVVAGGPVIGVWEIGLSVGAAGLFLLCFLRPFFRQSPES